MRRLASYFVITALMVLIGTSASGATPQEMVAEAEKAYKEARYAEAAGLFESLSDSLGTSAVLLGNIGNCYVKAGDYGRAMLAYRKALKIDPSNREIKGNVRYVESKVVDNNRAELKGKRLSVLPDSPSFFSSIHKFISLDHLSDTWAVYSAVSFILLLGAIGAYLFSKNVAIRKTGFFGGIFLAVMCVATLAFAEMAASDASKTSVGVITAYKYNLHNEPYATSKVNPVALTRGTVMRVIGEETSESWYKVRLNSDFVGWIPASEFEVF